MKDSLSKTKTLILLPSLKRCGPVLGGVALAKYIDKKRYEVVVGCLSRNSLIYAPLLNDLKGMNIHVHWFGIPGWIGVLRMARVRKYIENEKIDIVHTYGIRPDFISAMACGNCIRIASIRGMFRDEYRLKYGNIIASIFAFLHITALSRMNGIIAISNAMRNWLIEEGMKPKKTFYIANFVDIGEIEHLLGKKPAENCNGNKQSVNFGFWGKFIRNKRVEWLIRALYDLKRIHPDKNIQLHLAGDGPFLGRVQELAKKLNVENDVVFYGYISDISEILSHIDLAVLASRTEGIPRMLMEAMSLGITCIGPRIGGVNELIRDEQTGYFFDPLSYEDLLSKIEKVLVHKNFLDHEKIRNHVMTYFNAREGAQKTVQLYDHICKMEVQGMNDTE